MRERTTKGDRGGGGFIELCNRIKACKKPIVCKINGPALGGGIGLVFMGDIRIATRDSFFAFTEVKRGLVPAMISTFIVPELGSFLSKEMFLTGRRVPAKQALDMGFLTAVAKDNKDDFERLTQEYLNHLLSSAPDAMRMIKGLVQYELSHTHEENAVEAVKVFQASLMSEETKYGLKMFKEKKEPDWSNFQIKAKL